MSRSVGLGYARADGPAAAHRPAARLGLAALCLLQVTVVYPIASPAVGVLVALATTLPIAWRRTSPVGATIVASLAWVIPTDGYLFLGYVVAFLLYFSLATHVGPARTVIAVAALGVALSVASAAIRGDVAGEYFGALVISMATVTTHVRHVLQKLRLRDRVQAVVVAYESGLIPKTPARG